MEISFCYDQGLMRTMLIKPVDVTTDFLSHLIHTHWHKNIRLIREMGRWSCIKKDMASGYIATVLEQLPKADLVLDHFHLVKWFNDKLSLLRRQLYQQATMMEKAVSMPPPVRIQKNVMCHCYKEIHENLKNLQGLRKITGTILYTLINAVVWLILATKSVFVVLEMQKRFKGHYSDKFVDFLKKTV